MEAYEDIKKAEKGAWLSIITYICLAIVKITISYMGTSEALRADGLNNATDVIASVSVLIGLKIARKPPDRNHPYGHFRAETVASLIAAFIMFSVGIEVLFSASESLYQANSKTPDMITAWVALFSAVVMYVVYRFNLNLAKKINSQSLNAAAQDNRSDALVSIGAFVGIAGSQFQIYWLDTVTALVVGIIICKTAWDIFRESSLSLTDGFNESMIQKLKETVYTTPGVKGVKDIKGRMHGNQPLVDITICVEPKLNVVESHKITEEIETRMHHKHNIRHVHIHIEPY